jgi:hypothetical protein
MVRHTGLLAAISLAVLAVLIALLMLGEEQQTMATCRQPTPRAPQSPLSAQELTHTLSLPVVARCHDPSYLFPFGVAMYGAVDDAAGLQTMKNAGIRWATTTLYWGAIEPSKGVLDWSSFDAKAQNARAAGIDLFVLFTGNPSWAAPLPGGPVYNIQDLVDFVTLMAERYDCDGVDDAPGHPCVHYWSFYGEPDNGDLLRAQQGKGYWGHNGAGFAAMLSQVSPAIHHANPRAKVLIGGVAYDWFEEDGGPFVRSFLGDTLAALNTLGGARAYIDAVAFHYYPINPSWSSIGEKILEIRAIMIDHGVGDLPLLSPEMGYWSSPCFGSSETGQAYWLVRNHVIGLSEGVRILSWCTIFDLVVACSPEDKYPDRTSGLLNVNGNLKPSYFAYQTMTRELGMARYVAPFQADGATGYTFAMPWGQEKTVLWGKAGTVRISFPYTHLRLVTALGVEVDIWDNGAGDLDGGIVGQIELQFYENQPCYVEKK